MHSFPHTASGRTHPWSAFGGSCTGMKHLPAGGRSPFPFWLAVVRFPVTSRAPLLQGTLPHPHDPVPGILPPGTPPPTPPPGQNHRLPWVPCWCLGRSGWQALGQESSGWPQRYGCCLAWMHLSLAPAMRPGSDGLPPVEAWCSGQGCTWRLAPCPAGICSQHGSPAPVSPLPFHALSGTPA